MAFTAGGPNRRSLRDRLREGIQIPFQAKSRSVDQSFHLNNPFADLDIISRVTTSHSNTTSRDSTSSTPHSETPTSASPVKQQQQLHPSSTASASSTSSGGSSSISGGSAGGAIKKQETITYTVKENDTITSVSASFDITPSELIKTNRLSTRTIFPGQVLRIPPKSKLTTPNNSPVKSLQHGQREGNNNGSRGAGVSFSSGTSSSGGNYPKSESSRKFIKINVKHITDGNGVVSGTLLVTPNAVMFDPNVSDPLVIEQGAETYGVILPLEIIVHCGIYSDIAFMKVKGKDFVPPGPKPDLYPNDSSSKAAADSKEGTAPASSTTTTTAGNTTTTASTTTAASSNAPGAVQSQIGESTNVETVPKKGGEGSMVGSAATTTTAEATTSTTSTVQQIPTMNEADLVHDSGFETGRPSPAIPNEDLPSSQQQQPQLHQQPPQHPSHHYQHPQQQHPQQQQQQQQQPEESRKQKVLKRLSFPLAWMESLGGKEEAPPVKGDSSRQNSKEEAHSAPPESKINYRSLVSLDDMPDLFASIDKLMTKPAGVTADVDDQPPWYLCLTMGKPKHRKIRSLIVSYGQKKCIKPEYWFSIPRNQVDDLYKFWMLWWPHLYGELDPAMVEQRGYELVDWDTDLFAGTEDEAQIGDDKAEDSNSTFDSIAMKGEQLGELTKESWEMIKAPYVKFYSFIRSQTLLSGGDEDFPEVVSMSEELRRALYGSEELIPELIGESEILEEEDIKNLGKNLTARAEGYPWLLVFSTSRDGFSLNSLYRKMQGVESPVLILVEDTKQRVFGALVSCALHVSDHFYGTGQSFLFTCRPNFNVFKWTGENMYFIKGNYESLSIGAGDGKFGLWLDGDLFVGRTEGCSTYGNSPLVEENDFVVKTLECWVFGRP